MAEFKLGRIRFVWQGEWTDDHNYVVDDVVNNGAKSYICVANHTSSSLFDTDLLANPTNWNLVSDGTRWTGDWLPNHYYSLGDQVKYGGLIYVCKEAHTSDTYTGPTYNGLEPDLDKWDVFATTFNWSNTWATDHRYRINDFVVYGGTTYICKEGHISAATDSDGLEVDSDKWDVFNQGITYLSTWTDGVRYKLNDVVTYGPDLWICIDPYTSSSDFTTDSANWALFLSGFQFENSWNNSTNYQIGDIVTYGGYSYISRTNHINKQPSSNPTDWSVFITGFNFQGDWLTGSSYKVGDVVRLHGYTYVATADNSATTPPNAGYWSRLNSGLQWTNNAQTYLEVSGTTLTGIGSGAKFDVVRSGSVYTITVSTGFEGVGYAVGNTIKILGTSTGGITPANDIIITVDGVSSTAISDISWTGFSVTWKSSVSYVLGDVVFFGAHSYTCISGHTSSLGNRPDADSTGTYWNLLAAGSEALTLTTPGDMVYYSASGPTRLPIGEEGQILRTSDGYPIWKDYGEIHNVVYVGPLGEDVAAPTAGLTIDKPWKSVRFAAKQVEDGYLNPQATALIAKNKQFLIKEVNNFIVYTYTVDITGVTSGEFTTESTAGISLNMPIEFDGTVGGVTAGVTYYVKAITTDLSFTISATPGGVVIGLTTSSTPMIGTFVYDSDKTERDAGYIIDALIHDIGRGGNLKTVTAARAYYDATGASYITTGTELELSQFIGAQTYMSSLVSDVLSNLEPANNYQTLVNGVEVAPQIVDETLTAETDTVQLAQDLILIITSGLSAGSAAALPISTNPNTTIFVKTGTYNEVLPIVVPSYTSIVGDELRGTVVQPKSANAMLVNDMDKTISSLNRVKSLVPFIVSNASAPATTGNTETQVSLFSNNLATGKIQSNVNTMIDIVANGLSSVPTYILTTPTGGSGNAFDADYFNAARLVYANKAFLQAEITAWINVQIAAAGGSGIWNAFVYDQVPCERDIGYIVDALRYDLTYGGNLATQIAARSYYSNGVLVETGEQEQAKAVQVYLKSIIDDIANGNAIVKSSGNAATQDTSGTKPVGSSPATFAQARIQEIYDTLNTGTSPTTIAPSTSWVSSTLTDINTAVQAVKSHIQSNILSWIKTTYPDMVFNATTCSRDIGYMIDALCYDMMFNSNYLSSQNGMSYYRALTSTQLVLSSQFDAQLGTIALVGASIREYTSSLTGTVGSFIALDRVVSSADIIYDIVNGGAGQIPGLVRPDPTGYNTSFLAGYGDGRTGILNNYDFIIADIQQYIQNGYAGLWSSLGSTGQAKGERDLGYILDAIMYDMTYGGNTQTLIAGSSYYTGYTLNLTAAEETAFLDGFGRLKTLISQIVLESGVVKTAGNPLNWDTSGTPGSAGAATFAQDRVQDIIDWITDGVAPTTIAPSIAWVSQDLQNAFNAIQDKSSEIQSDALVWSQKYFQNVTFDNALALRDAREIVNAISYDVAFGSNFASIVAGRAYLRDTTSALALINGPVKAVTLGAINFMKYKVKNIASVGSVAQIHTTIDDITKFIDGGSIPRVSWTSPSTVTTAVAGAAVLLTSNKEFIKAEIIQYITDNYPSVEYNRETCSRDVGYIVDAVRYDLTYGGNFACRQAGLAYYSGTTLQIDSGDKTATLAAYNYLATVIADVIQDNAVSALQGKISQVRASARQSVGTSGTAVTTTALVGVITTTINNVASVPAETLASTSWVDADLVTQYNNLQSARTTIIADIIDFIDTTYPTLVYDQTLAERDAGVVLDAVSYDLMFNCNYRSVLAAEAYYRISAVELQGDLKIPTVQSLRLLKTQILDTISSNATAYARAKVLLDIVINTAVNGAGSSPEVNGTMSYNNDAGIIRGVELLRANKQFLVNESTAWVNKTFGGTVTNTSSSGNLITTSETHNLIVGDPVIFTETVTVTAATAATASNDRFTITDTTNVIAGMPVIFTGTTFGGVTSSTTYFVKTVGVGYITISTSSGGLTFDIGADATGLMTATIGATFGGLPIDTTLYVLTVPSTTTFTVTTEQGSAIPVSLTTSSGIITATYGYNVVSCQRDMSAFIDAIIDDVNFTSNYKSLRAATLYKNAINGSEKSDFYLVRNSTGIRNQTLNGLTGELSEENDYGTKRPTAGSYTSLDPGFGPNDTNSWVTTRSCYTQNCTMFGTACVGMKIDGALHAGGNRSIVANDYTTILSDGIGVWCTGSNSLTELVSVFNYYGYAGYLAELGGRIRATNGNSSYGTYGVIAEGTDTSEIPIYATLDNRYNDAQIGLVVTDSTNEVLSFEFTNAGSNYTNAAYEISGSGYNATAIGDEFRDGAVFETRLIDNNDGNGYGGTNYLTSANTAQAGDVGYITIAAADTQLSTAYAGMRIVITGGTGVGQYAQILSYNNGNKDAFIIKDSFGSLTVTNTSITNNLLTVASTANLTPGMAIYLGTGATNGVSANTLYYVRNANFSSTQFSVSLTGPNDTAETITSTASGLTIPLYAAGWDHVVPGKTITNALDLTSTYVIEPHIRYAAPGYTGTARTLSATAQWKSVTYAANNYVAIAYGTATSYSTDGKTWANAGSLPSSVNWVDVMYGGGEGATATAIVGGLGGYGAVLTAVLGEANTNGDPLADQVKSVTVESGGTGYTTAPTILFTSASGAGAVATCTVLNGAIQSVTVTIPGSGYLTKPTVTAATDRVTSIVVNTWGKNYAAAPTVTLTGGGSSNQATGTASLTNGGVSSIAVGNDGGSGYTSTPTVSIVDTTAKFIAIPPSSAGSTKAAYTVASNLSVATAWSSSTGNLPSGTYQAAVFGNGVYVAVGGTASATSSTDGQTWSTRTIPTLGAGSYAAIAYGNGYFIAIQTSGVSTARSANGISWAAGGNLPTSTTWTSIAYGNGRFVAIASGGRNAAYSIDQGANWIASPIGLPSSQTWSKVIYGQGVFLAVAQGTTVCATSPDGVIWTVRAMPGSSTNWLGGAFGNPSHNGLFVAVSNTSGTVGASIKTGATAIARAKVATESITEIRMLEPGSGYPKGTVTATTTSTNVISVDTTENLVDSQPVEFTGVTDGGLELNVTYYVIGSTIVTNTSFKVSATPGSASAVALSTTTGLTGTYRAGPILTQTDPNKVITAPTRVRMGDGALGNPSFSNRGSDNATATASLIGDGYSDLYQASNFINIAGLFSTPVPGSNVQFASIPDTWFKLVAITNVLGTAGNYTATFQINPALSVYYAPAHSDSITIQNKYSQVRLTGHDFLYIGTGNFTQTNYPNVDTSTAVTANQELATGGGRVFFTSTDQDGNFNVGNLFGVQQSTGTATLNASAFNLSGLQSLQLGSVTVGASSASITQFSTDPYFTANSDHILPTQRAVKAYITAQIGGGQSSLNVNTLTSGVIYVANNTISTTTGVQINVKAKMNFTGGIDGAPVALGYFLQK